MRKNLAIIYGGASVEHDVSVITALQVMGYLKAGNYKVFPVYIRDGFWYTGKALFDLSFYKAFNARRLKRAVLKNKTLYHTFGPLNLKVATLDCAVIASHGGIGEDGTLQGYLDINGIPYASSGVLPSATTMYKPMSKTVADGLNILTSEYMCISAYQCMNMSKTVARITKKLGTRVVVKPASLGSSIGVTVAEDTKSLQDALSLALEFGDDILVERALKFEYELNIALYINEHGEIVFGNLEKPLKTDGVLSFDDKYMSGSKGMSSLSREVPANVSEKIARVAKGYAKRLYIELGLRGIVRMDFMVEGGLVYFNEINSIPGSLALYLFDNKPDQVLSAVINRAIYDAQRKRKFVKSYASNILCAANLGAKSGAKLP